MDTFLGFDITPAGFCPESGEELKKAGLFGFARLHQDGTPCFGSGGLCKEKEPQHER